MSQVGQDLLSVPFAEMVSNLAIAIADSQVKLDRASIDIAKLMGDKEKAPVYLPNITVDKTGQLMDEETPDIVTSMIGAGFQPTFYQFTDTIIEVKMAITMHREQNYERTRKGNERRYSWSRGSFRAYSTPVDAKYSSKYSYHVEGSSLLRTKITPTPPNPFMQRILDMKADAVRLSFELQIKQAELALEEQKKQMEEAIEAEEEKQTATPLAE